MCRIATEGLRVATRREVEQAIRDLDKRAPSSAGRRKYLVDVVMQAPNGFRTHSNRRWRPSSGAGACGGPQPLPFPRNRVGAGDA